jgi:uncharacterized protein (TIGR02001 family)
MNPLTPTLVFLLPMPALAFDASGQFALTSDYVFRGISQSGGKAAVQVGARVDATSGLYASAWASTVRFDAAPDASSELDLVAGWRGTHGVWAFDVNATRFVYPTSTVSLRYTEAIATMTWRDRAWLMLGVSNDVFATGQRGVYTQVGLLHPLRDRLRLELAGGHYDLDDAYGRSYAHAQATLAWTPHPRYELRLTAHTTNDDARALFGPAAGPRFELSLLAKL